MSTSVVVKALRYIAEYRGPVAVTPQTAADVRAGVEDMGSALYWLKTFLHDKIMGEEQRVIGRSGDQLEITGHGIPSNAAVRIFPSPVGTTYAGTIPTPLAENTVYYVRVIDADHIELSETSGPGAAVTLTGGIAGDVWIQEVTDWVSNLLVTNATYGSGLLKDLVVWLAGAQTVTGAKTFADLTMSSTNKVKLAARTIARVADRIGKNQLTIATFPMNVAATEAAEAYIDPPHGSTITSISVRIDPGAGGALPGVLPKIALYTIDVDGTTSAAIGEVFDTPVDNTAYRAAHTITSSGLATVVDRSAYRYLVLFTQEDGVAGLLGSASVSFATTAYDDGAG